MPNELFLALAILSTGLSALTRIIINNIGKDADPNPNPLQQQRLKTALLDVEFYLALASVILLATYIFRN